MNEVQKHATVSQPRLSGLCGDREQKVLGRPARDVRANLEKAMAEGDRLRQRHRRGKNDKSLQAMKDAGKTEFHD